MPQALHRSRDLWRPQRCRSAAASDNVLTDHRSVNAVAESFFATLKNELIYCHVWPTRRHAGLAIFEFIAGWYNQRRRHSTLGYCSPAEVELRTSPGILAT
jgi:transposase InsO family protein